MAAKTTSDFIQDITPAQIAACQANVKSEKDGWKDWITNNFENWPFIIAEMSHYRILIEHRYWRRIALDMYQVPMNHDLLLNRMFVLFMLKQFRRYKRIA